MPENPQVKRDITQSFTKEYTVGLINYPVRDYLAPHPFVIDVDVEA
jgi:formylmethanofuran dehydrogenase subunit A